MKTAGSTSHPTLSGESQQGTQRLEDGLGVGEFPRLQLGVNLAAIGADLEASARGRYKPEGGDLLFEL